MCWGRSFGMSGLLGWIVFHQTLIACLELWDNMVRRPTLLYSVISVFSYGFIAVVGFAVLLPVVELDYEPERIEDAAGRLGRPLPGGATSRHYPGGCICAARGLGIPQLVQTE